MITMNYATSKRVHVKTKVSALHALVEIAMAVAHAPKNADSDDVRNGKAPGVLMESMLQVLEFMDDNDLKSVAKEEAFLFKAKGLSRKPRQEFDLSSQEDECSIWSGLEDVFRLLKVPGPIDFQRCSKKVKGTLELDQKSHLSGVQIVKVIRNEICAEVSRGTCYETKYNALDALVDIGYHILEKPLGVRADPELVADALN
jgi:hypothetical protein